MANQRPSIRKTEAAKDRAPEAAHKSREQEQHAHQIADMENIDFDAAYLKAPPPRPGMVQRWVRAALFGKDDVTNISRMYGKGWRPRSAKTIPDEFAVPSQMHGRFAEAFLVEGMVLCERPAAIAKQHRAHIRQKIDAVTAAVDAELRNASVRNPAYGPIEKQGRSVPLSRQQAAQLAGQRQGGLEPAADDEEVATADADDGFRVATD